MVTHGTVFFINDFMNNPGYVQRGFFDGPIERNREVRNA
jgi:hypothetical protein